MINEPVTESIKLLMHSPPIKRSLEEKVLIGLSVIGFIFIFPFAVYRIIQHSWAIAVVDLIISGTMLFCCVYVWRTRRVEKPSIILAVLALAGSLTSTGLLGASQIFWVYPAILMTYYLSSYKVAFVLCSSTTVILFFLISEELDRLTCITYFVTLLAASFFAFTFAMSVDNKQQLMKKMITQDPLTGINNRRALDEKLHETILNENRKPLGTCLLLFDLDHFKQVNDKFGHEVGDEVLSGLTHIVSQRLRATDQFFRFGGEEFAVIPSNTNLPSVLKLAENIREIVEQSQFPHNIKMTISIGVANCKSGDDERSLFNRADRALYFAKQNGRNKTAVADSKEKLTLVNQGIN